MSSDPTSSPYNPINGKELLKVIMSRAFDQLSLHQDFDEAITYPAYHFSLTIDLTVPHEDKHLISDTFGGVGIIGKADQKIHKVSATGASAPDHDRVDAGLHLPRPTLTPGGIVDVPTKP